MTTWPALTVFAALPVRDVGAAEGFYAQLFGRAPDGKPSTGIVEWYLVDPDLPEKGTLQIREDSERAGGGLATINVGDMKAASDAAAQLGLDFEVRVLPIQAEAVEAVSVAEILDPDGNSLTVVQPHLRR
ncbi:VOC family protein [Microbacterium sp. NPDC090007]|uniref:VOC family protein n=1 Tax=Microbacterium sp. NPDC090007 TaxID=3364204 RepID=UPI0038005C4C